jgi:hypothetical protein
MNTPVHKNLVVLARMLERLDRSTVPVDAQQYRTVVSRIGDELAALPAGAPLEAVLEAFPAVAELYENLHYAHAGLCRSPLERAMGAELAAREAIEAARHREPHP